MRASGLHSRPAVGNVLGVFKAKAADELGTRLSNLERVDIGKGKHYVQEDQPDAIGEALRDWLGRPG